MDCQATVEVHFDQHGFSSVDCSFSLGKPHPESPQDIALTAVGHEAGDILKQLTDPEVERVKQAIFEQWGLQQ